MLNDPGILYFPAIAHADYGIMDVVMGYIWFFSMALMELVHHSIQGRSQDFRKKGGKKMSSDCARSAQNWRAGSHAHPLNHVRLVIQC